MCNSFAIHASKNKSIYRIISLLFIARRFTMVNPKASPFSGWVNPATYEAKIYCFYNDLDELEVYSLSMQSFMSSDTAELDGGYALFNSGYIYDTAIGWA
jgi:hypothetical protein